MNNIRTAYGFGIKKYAQVSKHSLFHNSDLLRSRITTATTCRLSKATYSSTSTATAHKTSRLHDYTAMITGGSSGIGYAIAERFLQEGASKVILVGRRREKLQDATKLLAGTLGLQAQGLDQGSADGQLATRAPENDSESMAKAVPQNIEYIVGDVSIANEWMAELEKAMTNVDILVNAAGISTSNILPRTTPDQISEMLKTNLEGAIYTSRAMLKACMRARLKEKKNMSDRSISDSAATTEGIIAPSSKCIINISSLLAMKGVTGTVTYAASKAGLLGLTRSMAVEAADVLKGSNTILRCNAIIPGYIDTPMIQDFSNDQVNAVRARIPLNRFGDPREIADAAVFLSSNEYANNCVLNLDGGLSAV